MINPVTGTTYAMFEPALDYVVAKIPRFPFDKFEHGERRLGTQMKATGEVMAIGRNIEESLLKACRSLEIGVYHNEMPELADVTDDALVEKIVKAQDDRLFYLSEAIRRGYTIEELSELTKIDIFFLDKLLHVFELEQELATHVGDVDVLKEAKRNGFSDRKMLIFGIKQLTKSVRHVWKIILFLFTRWLIPVRLSSSHQHHISTQLTSGKMNQSNLIKNLSSFLVQVLSVSDKGLSSTMRQFTL